MATLLASPEYPIPRQKVRVTFSGLNANTTAIQVFAVTAPEGSTIRKRIDGATRERARVYEGAATDPWDLTPEVGGVYTFQLEELQTQSASRAMFQGDPAGASQPTILATSTVVLRVGQRMQTTVGASPHTAQLRVYVWNDTVRSTSMEVHGEVTPKLYNPTTQTAMNAANNPVVKGVVDALAGETVDSIIDSVDDVYTDIRTKYLAHIANTTHHSAADTWNTIGTGYTLTKPAGVTKAINELRAKLRGHQDNLVEAGSGATPPHPNADGTIQFLTSGASSDVASQMAALADLWLAYDGHRNRNTPIHVSQDTTNAPADLPPLLEVHMRFLEALNLQQIDAPAEVNDGVAVLAQLGGFTEA